MTVIRDQKKDFEILRRSFVENALRFLKAEFGPASGNHQGRVLGLVLKNF